MNFAPAQPPRRRGLTQDGAIVPMINVVFLLLIFFLMTAQITAPDPMEITPPAANATPTDPLPGTLFVAADGRLAYGGAEGAAALAALAGHPADQPLNIRADAALPAAELARLLPQITGAGITDIRLITVQP